MIVPRSLQECLEGAPRALKSADDRPKSEPRVIQERPQWAPRGLPRRPGELLGTILRRPNSKQAPFADQLLRDLRKRCVGNDFSSIFHSCAKASNLIWTRPYRVEMRFDPSANESTHSSERASLKHQNRPLGAPQIVPKSTKIALLDPFWSPRAVEEASSRDVGATWSVEAANRSASRGDFGRPGRSKGLFGRARAPKLRAQRSVLQR